MPTRVAVSMPQKVATPTAWREFVREAGNGLGADGIAALERMAAADGDYSKIERDCVRALAG